MGEMRDQYGIQTFVTPESLIRCSIYTELQSQRQQLNRSDCQPPFKQLISPLKTKSQVLPLSVPGVGHMHGTKRNKMGEKIKDQTRI